MNSLDQYKIRVIKDFLRVEYVESCTCIPLVQSFLTVGLSVPPARSGFVNNHPCEHGQTNSTLHQWLRLHNQLVSGNVDPAFQTIELLTRSIENTDQIALQTLLWYTSLIEAISAKPDVEAKYDYCSTGDDIEFMNLVNKLNFNLSATDELLIFDNIEVIKKFVTSGLGKTIEDYDSSLLLEDLGSYADLLYRERNLSKIYSSVARMIQITLLVLEHRFTWAFRVSDYVAMLDSAVLSETHQEKKIVLLASIERIRDLHC